MIHKDVLDPEEVADYGVVYDDGISSYEYDECGLGEAGVSTYMDASEKKEVEEAQLDKNSSSIS